MQKLNNINSKEYPDKNKEVLIFSPDMAECHYAVMEHISSTDELEWKLSIFSRAEGTTEMANFYYVYQLNKFPFWIYLNDVHSYFYTNRLNKKNKKSTTRSEMIDI